MAEPDIRVLVGVEGGSTASGASGQLIRKELEKIAQEIGRDPPKIKLSIDTSSIKAQIKDLSKTLSISLTSSASSANQSVRSGASTNASKNVVNQIDWDIQKREAAQKRFSDQLKRQMLENARIEQEQQSKAIAAEKERQKLAKERVALETQAARDAFKSSSDSASIKQTKAGFEKYLKTIKASAVDLNSVKINEVFSELDLGNLKEAQVLIKSFKAEMKSAGYEGGNTFTYLGEKIKTFSVYLASSAITTGFVTSVYKAIDTAFELDKALVDLRIVTGGTKESAEELIDVYNRMAIELGSTTTAVAESAVEWQRQGYNLDDTNTLIKDSMVLSIVGMVDAAEASKYLTSAMKGYKVEASNAMGIVDKLTGIDIKAAVSAGGLAEAMARTANSARQAGVDMDNLLGYLAAVGEVTQRDMSTVGEAFKTIFARYGNVKLGRLIDDDGDPLNDFEKALNAVGISLRNQEGQFRDFNEVIQETGRRWESLKETEKSAIATTLGGVRQRENVFVLFENLDKAMEYSAVSANSAGTAMQKFSAYQEGLEFKLKENAAAFEHFADVIINSNFVGFLIDAGTAILKVSTIGDGFIAKIALLSTSIYTASNAINMIKKSSLGVGTAKIFGDLGWPEMTGDRLYYCA